MNTANCCQSVNINYICICMLVMWYNMCTIRHGVAFHEGRYKDDTDWYNFFFPLENSPLTFWIIINILVCVRVGNFKSLYQKVAPAGYSAENGYVLVVQGVSQVLFCTLAEMGHTFFLTSTKQSLLLVAMADIALM